MNKNKHDPGASYDYHRNHDEGMIEANELPSCYVDPESIDAWLHNRLLDTVKPLLTAYPDARWLTVGDGKYGSDAFYLQDAGADVTATSLSDVTLNRAKELGYLKKGMSLNAESMDLDDNSYDFVVCKAAYHHFPRPPIAFYEMLRVCSKAVILIEPTDGSRKPMGIGKVLVKKVLNKETSGFEPSGNYIFKVNIDEISKMMTALNFESVSYRMMNEFYHKKLSHKPFSPGSFATITTKVGLAIQDLLCSLRLLNYGLSTFIAFKEPPNEQAVESLSQLGFKHKKLPKNPYLL